MGMGKRKRKRKRGNRSFILIFQTFSIYEAKVILNRYYHQMPYHIHFKLTLICRNLNQKNFKARACNLNLFTGLIKSFTVLFSFLCNQLTLLVQNITRKKKTPVGNVQSQYILSPFPFFFHLNCEEKKYIIILFWYLVRSRLHYEYSLPE